MGIANEVSLNHVSQDSKDIKRLAKFYQELFGFEVVEPSPGHKYNVIWLKLPTLNLHLIESDPDVEKLEKGALWNSPTSLVGDPKNHLRGFHICLSVSNFEAFHETLKEKGIETHTRCLANGKVNHVYFSDPDGNGVEITNPDVY